VYKGSREPCRLATPAHFLEGVERVQRRRLGEDSGERTAAVARVPVHAVAVLEGKARACLEGVHKLNLARLGRCTRRDPTRLYSRLVRVWCCSSRTSRSYRVSCSIKSLAAALALKRSALIASVWRLSPEAPDVGRVRWGAPMCAAVTAFREGIALIVQKISSMPALRVALLVLPFHSGMHTGASQSPAARRDRTTPSQVQQSQRSATPVVMLTVGLMYFVLEHTQQRWVESLTEVPGKMVWPFRQSICTLEDMEVFHNWRPNCRQF
jgi:hypothetical protein